MKAYDLRLKRSAERDLDNLPSRTHDRIIARLMSLKENPLPVGVVKLKGREGYRLRVGDYRVIYTVDDINMKVEVLSVAHRKEVYRV